MNYNELKQHAEMCQIAADEMAYSFTDYLRKSDILARFQSHVEPNLFFIHSIWPELIIHIDSIDFLLQHKDRLKRKLKLAELLKFDFIINSEKPETWDEFTKLLKPQNEK